MNILISCIQMQRAMPTFKDTFDRLGLAVECPPVEQAMSEEELVAVLPRFDGMIAGDDVLTARVLRAAPRLRVISKWGVGVDGIDRIAAKNLGIAVFNTPGAFDDTVADVCVGYLIMLTRHLHTIDSEVRLGIWSHRPGSSLANKRLGIIGLGGIGLALARRALVMKMDVVGCDVDRASIKRAEEIGVQVIEMQPLLSTCDAVSLNCPLTPENVHLLSTEAFEIMRRGSLVINTARGKLIDEAALIWALEEGIVGGVALDVFEQEPLAKGAALARFPNAILGSHNASNAVEAAEAASARAVANLLDGLGLT